MEHRYQVVFTRKAKKMLSKLDRRMARMIVSWIRKNLEGCTDPRAHGKALKGAHTEAWRYAVGQYRLVAHIADEKVTITVVLVGHRKDIYQTLDRQ